MRKTCPSSRAARRRLISEQSFFSCVDGPSFSSIQCIVVLRVLLSPLPILPMTPSVIRAVQGPGPQCPGSPPLFPQEESE